MPPLWSKITTVYLSGSTYTMETPSFTSSVTWRRCLTVWYFLHVYKVGIHGGCKCSCQERETHYFVSTGATEKSLHSWRILHSYYILPTSCVQVNALSQESTLGRGVTQSLVLSPFLFLVVINKLLKKLVELRQVNGLHRHHGSCWRLAPLYITPANNALHAQ